MSSKALLKRLIREILMNEIDVEEVGEMCFTQGSTHDMMTCKISGNKYYLKFSSKWGQFDEDVDPSLQVLSEYLAYRVYGLYENVNLPSDIQLVYDKSESRVGIATTPAKGEQALEIDLDYKELAKSLSSGVYVDVLLANYDVVGTGSGNVFFDKETSRATRLDPGASFLKRAQGKNKPYEEDVPELETMLSTKKFPHGVGRVYQHADLKEAAQNFLEIPISQIMTTISNVDEEITKKLQEGEMNNLISQWKNEVSQIKKVIVARYKKISDHARFVLEQG